MKAHLLKLISLLMVAAVVSFACGGGSSEQQAMTESPEKAEPAKAEEKAEATPAEIGQKIGDLYVQAMSDVTELLKDKPAVAEVKAEVEKMRQDCIVQMVELGKLREALDAAGRAAVDSQIRMKVNSLSNKPWYSTYNEIQMHYFKDREFHKKVLSFNIITQYANFDLLKKQEPEEARRLGIE